MKSGLFVLQYTIDDEGISTAIDLLNKSCLPYVSHSLLGGLHQQETGRH